MPIRQPFPGDPYWRIASLFVLIKLGLHLFTYDHYELHRDELLYFNQGDHPGWGNATVPPFIGWMAFLIKQVFGYAVLGIRLLPMLLGAVSVLLIALVVKRMGGGRLALALSCTAFVFSPGFLLFNSLFTVNVFDQFFWLLITVLFMRMIDTGNPKAWIGISIASGIAFLNKYLVVYLLAGFILTLLVTPHRKLLFNRFFVVGCMLGLLVIAPNIYWQYAHGWPIRSHITELNQTQLVHLRMEHVLAELFDLNYVSTFFWLAGLLVILFKKTEQKYRYLGIATIIVAGLFMLSKGKAYYLLGLIPALFAASGYVFEKYLVGKWNFLVLSLIFLCSCLALPFSIPLLSFENLNRYAKKTSGFVSYPFSRWEDGKKHPVSQVFSDMTGWKEMVSLVNEAYQQIPESQRKHATIYAERNYGYAGAVHFYGKAYHLPEAITFLDSYVLWAPDTIAHAPLIYINYETAGMEKLFNTCTETGRVNDPYFRENGLKVFLCQEPNEQMQEVYRQKAIAEKGKYKLR